MCKSRTQSEKTRKSKRIITIVLMIILMGALLTAIYFRANPTWKAAKLTIEPAGRFFEIQSLEPSGTTLESRILPPDGYTRIPTEDNSFSSYLRNYPLLPDDIKLPVYDGSTINSTVVAAIFDISLGTDGYQQCADSIIRLYSDYFYETNQLDKISFQFSNGDVCNYNKWSKGWRMLAFSDFSFELPAALPDNSEQQYRNYLKEVMRYAGTLSLQKESEVIPSEELRTGDIICNDVHVVMIVDEAVNNKGEKCFLIGQSFIPAVCFHIISQTEGKTVSPWFTQKQLEEDSFVIGSFQFGKENIRRWKNGF